MRPLASTHEDGNIECEVRATGIMVVSQFAEEVRTRTARSSTTARMRRTTNISSWLGSSPRSCPLVRATRTDYRCDKKNSPLRTQAEGKQDFNWEVVNDDVHKGLGTPPAYKRGRASPVPAATIRTFRAPYAGKSITAALPGSSPLPWPSPFSSGLDTPSPHPSPGR